MEFGLSLYVKIYVDGVLSKDIAVPETETSITLASGLEKGTHTIKVIKRTSGYYSIVGLSKIQLDAGSEIRETQKYFERKMLFIDSKCVKEIAINCSLLFVVFTKDVAQNLHIALVL